MILFIPQPRLEEHTCPDTPHTNLLDSKRSNISLARANVNIKAWKETKGLADSRKQPLSISFCLPPQSSSQKPKYTYCYCRESPNQIASRCNWASDLHQWRAFDHGSHPVPTPTLMPLCTVHPHPQIAVLAPHTEIAWDPKPAAHASGSWKYSSTLAPDPLLPAQRNRHPYIVNVRKQTQTIQRFSSSVTSCPHGWA